MVPQTDVLLCLLYRNWTHGHPIKIASAASWFALNYTLYNGT